MPADAIGFVRGHTEPVRRWIRSANVVAGVVLNAMATGCGNDRPTDAERVLVPLVPDTLPDGYVLSRIDERPLPDGGRWIDVSLSPADDPPTEPRRVVSLHQRLDVEPPGDFYADAGAAGRRLEMRGTLGVCDDDGGFLRWVEAPTAHLSIGGGGFTCEELVPIAESLHAVDEATWRRYEASGRDE